MQKQQIEKFPYWISLLGATASIIVFAFMNFQTKNEALRERQYSEDKIQSLDRSISELKSQVKDLNKDLSAKLDQIIDAKRRYNNIE